MVKFISNGKSKHMAKGQEFTVTQELYDIFVKAGYIQGEEKKQAPKKESK